MGPVTQRDISQELYQAQCERYKLLDRIKALSVELLDEQAGKTLFFK